jgi:hypothetical protein
MRTILEKHETHINESPKYGITKFKEQNIEKRFVRYSKIYRDIDKIAKLILETLARITLFVRYGYNRGRQVV